MSSTNVEAGQRGGAEAGLGIVNVWAGSDFPRNNTLSPKIKWIARHCRVSEAVASVIAELLFMEVRQ